MAHDDDQFWAEFKQSFIEAQYSQGTAPPAGMIDWVIAEVRSIIATMPSSFDTTQLPPEVADSVMKRSGELVSRMLQLAIRLWLAEHGVSFDDGPTLPTLTLIPGGKAPSSEEPAT